MNPHDITLRCVQVPETAFFNGHECVVWMCTFLNARPKAWCQNVPECKLRSCHRKYNTVKGKSYGHMAWYGRWLSEVLCRTLPFSVCLCVYVCLCVCVCPTLGTTTPLASSQWFQLKLLLPGRWDWRCVGGGRLLIANSQGSSFSSDRKSVV